MKRKTDDPVFANILMERDQGHGTRQKLFLDIEKELEGIPLVTFFTSFNFPVGIEHTDADMMEDVLKKLDLSKGLALMINSPGGDGLSSERIINICKNYSGTGEFIVIIPGKAKSAATMVCFGASKIYMSKTSELGPIDPQIRLKKGDSFMYLALYNIIKSYENLLKDANTTSGNIQPYLQQLSNYDAREIEEFRREMDLTKDVAIRALSKVMMKGKSDEDILESIKVFLTPETTKSHGRSIFSQEAISCGLQIVEIDLRSRLWKLVYELYVRTNQFTTYQVAKCIESKDYSFVAAGQNN